MTREEEKSEPIPFDLIIELLTRLPAKSIARFRCLSKLWDSTFRGPYFTDSFFTISTSRPKLLITCQKHGKTLFFSSPQPQNSSPLAANFHMSFSSNRPGLICRPVCGLVCGSYERRPFFQASSVPLICNPSTRQIFTLPKVEKTRDLLKFCIGYDPIDKQFKVLGITLLSCGTYGSLEYQVLTLGTEKKLLWRKVECDIPHSPAGVDFRDYYPVYDEICINGVCYYFARLKNDENFGVLVIVCFDIRLEKFNYIRIAQDMRIPTFVAKQVEATLVNYKDRLAKLQLKLVGGTSPGLQLWVLEDAEKHEWLSFTYVMPPPWRKIRRKTKLRIVGFNTRTGEIVLSPRKISNSFYLLYYNPERNTITRVEIQGMEAFKNCQVYTFLDHVENVKLMKSV